MTFHQDGKTVDKKVEGFQGSNCLEATQFIENALGTVEVKEESNDFWVPNPVGLDQTNKVFS